MTEFLGVFPYGEAPGSHWSAYGARVRSSVALTVANTTASSATFDTVVYDHGGFFTANGAVFTVPAGLGGFYMFGGAVRWMSEVSVGLNALSMTHNGVAMATNHSRFSSHGVAGLNATALSATACGVLASGDTISMVIFQNSGSARTTDSAQSTGAAMWIVRMDR